MAVVGLARLPVPENHAGCHGIRPLDIGVVETFYVARELLHSEGAPQLLHYLFMVFVRVDMLLLFHQVELEGGRILAAQFDKTGLFAALGHMDFLARHLHAYRLGHENFT